MFLKNKLKDIRTWQIKRLSRSGGKTTFVPEIIHNAIRGTLPPDVTLAKLYKLPDRRDEQLKQIGIVSE